MSADLSKTEPRELPKFFIETKCDVNQTILDDMNQLSHIQPVNGNLLKDIKELSTTEDFEKFNKTIDFKEVEDLVAATTDTWPTHNGYIISYTPKY